jgi:hypothetical protein
MNRNISLHMTLGGILLFSVIIWNIDKTSDSMIRAIAAPETIEKQKTDKMDPAGRIIPLPPGGGRVGTIDVEPLSLDNTSTKVDDTLNTLEQLEMFVFPNTTPSPQQPIAEPH